jgi:hypothetical protein
MADAHAHAKHVHGGQALRAEHKRHADESDSDRAHPSIPPVDYHMFYPQSSEPFKIELCAWAVNTHRLVDCHSLENVCIESLDPAKMCYAPSPGEDRHDRVVDFKKAMRTAPQRCIVLPTYKTMQTVINNHPEVFQAHCDMTAAARVQLIKDFLSSPTKKPKVGPSWLASFVRFHNVRGNLADATIRSHQRVRGETQRQRVVSGR